MKKKLLFIGITMNPAGTEKSFLSFINCINFDEYEVDLLLAKKEGLFLELIPPQVNVRVVEEYGDLFLLSGKNAASLLYNTFIKRHFASIFSIIPFFIKSILSPSTKHISGNRFWIKFMQKYLPPLKEHYDAAIAYWGDRTMFYMLDKVSADKYITWLHFDYANPPRDDKTYLEYFSKCDYIVTVSSIVNDALVAKLPFIKDKCCVIENINNSKLIKDLSLENKHFPDHDIFTGTRILSVGRMSYQKGHDMLIPVLARLKKEGYPIRWYIIGEGEMRDNLALQAMDNDIVDTLFLLEPTTNPYPYMRDCDIYAMPSRFEGKPISVEEAKILGCPIMITNYDSASEQLNGGKYGMIVPISAEGIYEGIKQLLDDKELRDRYTDTLMKTNFDNSDEVNKFIAML